MTAAAAPEPSAAASTLEFAAAARLLSAATRRHGLVAPSFRTPPRIVGVDRTIRRHPSGATVAVRVHGRPWAAVAADLIDGIVVTNRLDAGRANRVHADLWDLMHHAHRGRSVA